MPCLCANLAQNSREFPTELLVLEKRRQWMVALFVRQILCDTICRARFLRAKLREPGCESTVEQPGRQGLTTLTRSPATHNGTPDSRAQQPADALTNVDRNIPEHPFNANISRLSCPHFGQSATRH